MSVATCFLHDEAMEGSWIGSCITAKWSDHRPQLPDGGIVEKFKQYQSANRVGDRREGKSNGTTGRTTRPFHQLVLFEVQIGGPV